MSKENHTNKLFDNSDILKSSGIALRVGEEVEEKITFLCNEIKDREWSGVLFYRDHPKSDVLSFSCVDILLMDVGEVCSTIFSMTPDVIHYIATNNLLGCRCGLIHSHNNMSSYFSPTDINTMKKEALDNDGFMSLVVNNKGDYKAAFSRVSKITKEIFIKVDTKEDETKVMSDVDCFEVTVLKPSKTIKKFDEIKSRIKELESIKKEKEEKEKREGRQNELHSNLYTTPIYNYYAYYPSSLKGDSIVYGVDYEHVNWILCQLLSGNVVNTNPEVVLTEDFLKEVTASFEERFGTEGEAFNDFKCWADYMMEYLFYTTNDSDLGDLLKGMLEKLSSLTVNSRYIDYFKEQVSKIVKDYE